MLEGDREPQAERDDPAPPLRPPAAIVPLTPDRWRTSWRSRGGASRTQGGQGLTVGREFVCERVVLAIDTADQEDGDGPGKVFHSITLQSGPFR